MHRKNLVLFIKSIVVGMFMLVPGISGGTLAIILNIYEVLLSSLSHLFKNFKSNFLHLLIALLGGVLGVIISSYFMDFFITNFYFELLFLFVGITIYFSCSQIKNSKLSWYKKAISILIGSIVGYVIHLIPNGLFTDSNNFFVLFLLGIFLSVALILPGVSVSYIFLVFGMYEKIILSIKEFDVIYILKIGIFLIIGLLLVIKFLDYFINKKKEITENVILGFIVISLYNVIPEIKNINEFVYAMIFVLIGILIKSLFNVKK